MLRRSFLSLLPAGLLSLTPFGKQQKEDLAKVTILGVDYYMNGSTLVYSDDGKTIHHYNDKGETHRDDGPAIVAKNFREEWYKNNLLHREDGPAIVYKDGAEEWFKNGVRHRDGGPAWMNSQGVKKWFVNGQLHRIGRPAITGGQYGEQLWYCHGKLHREDGPAMTNPNEQLWFKDGIITAKRKSDWDHTVFFSGNMRVRIEYDSGMIHFCYGQCVFLELQKDTYRIEPDYINLFTYFGESVYNFVPRNDYQKTVVDNMMNLYCAR
jgi:hypothetical protein